MKISILFNRDPKRVIEAEAEPGFPTVCGCDYKIKVTRATGPEYSELSRPEYEEEPSQDQDDWNAILKDPNAIEFTLAFDEEYGPPGEWVLFGTSDEFKISIGILRFTVQMVIEDEVLRDNLWTEWRVSNSGKVLYEGLPCEPPNPTDPKWSAYWSSCLNWYGTM